MHVLAVKKLLCILCVPPKFARLPLPPSSHHILPLLPALLPLPAPLDYAYASVVLSLTLRPFPALHLFVSLLRLILDPFLRPVDLLHPCVHSPPDE